MDDLPHLTRVWGLPPPALQIRPFDNASLDQLVNQHSPTPLHRLQASVCVCAVVGGWGVGGLQLGARERDSAALW